MKACDNFVVFIFASCISAYSATVSEKLPDMIGITKEELRPIFISAGLKDTIAISAPVTYNTNTLYYLSNPKGDSIKLDINTSHFTTDYYKETSRVNYENHYNNGAIKTIVSTTKPYNFYQANLSPNIDNKHSDFTIGPLTENDHGNWVLSAYIKGNGGVLRELFQVITIEIVESIPTHAEKAKLIPGQTFEPRFLYPIHDLRSCEIIAPRTTFDRFYDRDRLHLDSCGFRIPNVTKLDEGPWNIIGVGKIVYKGNIYLEIDDENL
ncbi:uncharacterized protein LOC120633803 [Pararge aegeria]|uniref:Jg12008 protein n=1 Tax=Pararge aegeria aegeria TaxID=348720 RepID=A0A8S4R3W7_9NEOP|nr:uncharacterized protein LOC120633803 [Pararge aegeria]CAH2230705.1 jg12008 [Pararge aegeria aegeria]